MRCKNEYPCICICWRPCLLPCNLMHHHLEYLFHLATHPSYCCFSNIQDSHVFPIHIQEPTLNLLTAHNNQFSLPHLHISHCFWFAYKWHNWDHSHGCCSICLTMTMQTANSSTTPGCAIQWLSLMTCHHCYHASI